MKPYKNIKNKKAEKFKRLVGISHNKFCNIVEQIKSNHANRKSLGKRGKNKSKISWEDRILLVLYYLRHYPTFENLGNIFDISESYCYKIYTKMTAMLMKILKLPSRKELLDDKYKTLIIDVSEQPIERPKIRQKAFYSGKKHRHTIKAQLIICALTLQILSVVIGKGRQHDFTLFKASRLLLNPDTQLLADSGYQGIVHYHATSTIPFKNKKGQSLSAEEKAHNKALSKQRILIENVNRRCKIFRIVKEVYRGKHANYGRNWHLVAAIVNFRYAAS